MLALLLTAQLLTPSEAAAVLARLDSPANMTHVVLAPPPLLPPPIVIAKPASRAPQPEVVFRPLNCCSKYVIRAPRSGGHHR